MNKLRVLRNSNIFLILCGYQMHWFDVRLQRYRISLAGSINVFILACVYAGCFAEHFQPSAFLKTLHDVSPFLYGLTRMQLLLSVKVFSYAIYSSVRVVGVVNALTESMPMKATTSGKAGLKEELIAYGFIYSTHFVLICFGLYIGYEMEFKLPPLQDAMIGFALFLPHLVLAGTLRFYCILAWITRSRLKQLDDEVEELLNSSKLKTEMQLMTGVTVAIETAATPTTPSTVDNFRSQCLQLQQLGARFGAIFDSLQHSLLLLFIINGHCLLFGTYACTYYSNIWHVLFGERKHRIFYAGNACIYACIASDYVCLLFAQTSLEQQRLQFLSKLNSVLLQRTLISKKIRSVLKDMRSTLCQSFNLKFLSVWRFDLANFSLLQILQCIVIAIIVTAHYLNDAILVINENLDSSNNDE